MDSSLKFQIDFGLEILKCWSIGMYDQDRVDTLFSDAHLDIFGAKS